MTLPDLIVAVSLPRFSHPLKWACLAIVCRGFVGRRVERGPPSSLELSCLSLLLNLLVDAISFISLLSCSEGWLVWLGSLCQSVDEVATWRERGSRSHYSKCSVSGHSRPLMILWCDLVVVWFVHALHLSTLDLQAAAAHRTIWRWIAFLLLFFRKFADRCKHRPVMSCYGPQVQHRAISAGHLAVEICSEY